MYNSNSALLSQLYNAHGYHIHGTINTHALSTQKAGYGEPTQVVEINERLLAHNSSRWFDLHSIDSLTVWHNTDDIRQQMTDYINSLPTAAIIEDPRLSYTLPLWHDVLTPAGLDISIVVPYQNPLLFGAMMHQQHHISTRLAIALWVSYTLAVETHSRTYRRIFVSHDAIQHDWQHACQPIIELLAPAGLTNDLIVQLNAHVHMRRHTTPTTPQLSPRIRELTIAQIANDLYEAIQQPSIDEAIMTTLRQRFDAELADPQYVHDIGQFDTIFNDIFLDPEARIHALNLKHAQELHTRLNRQHSEFSYKIYQLRENHNKKLATYDKKLADITNNHDLILAETIERHELRINHMRTTFEQEIQYLNDKIATMHAEIEWRTSVQQQQQHTLDSVNWVIRIQTFIKRITHLRHKS
jgi:hypothetical protein